MLSDILNAIGRTPLVELRRCSPKPEVRRRNLWTARAEDGEGEGLDDIIWW